MFPLLSFEEFLAAQLKCFLLQRLKAKEIKPQEHAVPESQLPANLGAEATASLVQGIKGSGC